MSESEAVFSGAGNTVIRHSFYTYLSTISLDFLLNIIGSLINISLAGIIFGESALAAVGICSVLVDFVALVNGTVYGGFSVSMGNAQGRGDTDRFNRIVSMGIWFAIFFGILMALCGIFFTGDLAVIFGAQDPAVAAYAIPYLRVYLIAQILLIVNFAIRNALLALGYKTLCMMRSLVFIVMNLAGSLLFVLVFHSGIAGLALGTMVSELICAVFLILGYLRKPAGLHIFPPTPAVLKELKAVRYGLPMCTNFVAGFVLAITLNNVIAATIGTFGLAVFTVCKSIYQITFSVGFGSEGAITRLASALFGARDVDGLKTIFRCSFKMHFIVFAALMAVLILFHTQILALFGATEPQTIATLFDAFLWLIPIGIGSIVIGNFTAFYSSIEKIGVG